MRRILVTMLLLGTAVAAIADEDGVSNKAFTRAFMLHVKTGFPLAKLTKMAGESGHPLGPDPQTYERRFHWDGARSTFLTVGVDGDDRIMEWSILDPQGRIYALGGDGQSIVAE